MSAKLRETLLLNPAAGPAQRLRSVPFPTFGAEALLLVVEHNGPKMFARIAMVQALYPVGEPVFDPKRKATHWGKRKLKRDE